MLTRLAALSAAVLLPLTACSSEDPDTASDPGSEPAATESSATPAAACSYPADEQAPAKPVDPPSETPEVSGTVAATISLSQGDVPVELDADTTPCTVNSFVSLAKQGYFDGTQCHRVTTQGIWVLQCGDPSASGMGGPGYSFADELAGTETYGPGTLAMANAGPDTNGSQFFIVYKDSPLPPSYTVFGSLTGDGLAVVEKIGRHGAQGGAPDGAPAKKVTITGVSVG